MGNGAAADIAGSVGRVVLDIAKDTLQPQGYMMWAIERVAQFAADHESLDAVAR